MLSGKLRIFTCTKRSFEFSGNIHMKSKQKRKICTWNPKCPWEIFFCLLWFVQNFLTFMEKKLVILLDMNQEDTTTLNKTTFITFYSLFMWGVLVSIGNTLILISHWGCTRWYRLSLRYTIHRADGSRAFVNKNGFICKIIWYTYTRHWTNEEFLLSVPPFYKRPDHSDHMIYVLDQYQMCLAMDAGNLWRYSDFGRRHSVTAVKYYRILWQFQPKSDTCSGCLF